MKLGITSLALNAAYLSTVLPEPFHDDPADQVFVAKVMAEGATILKKDSRILDYEHVESTWRFCPSQRMV